MLIHLKKRCFTTIAAALLMMAITSHAQTVNKIPISEIDREYIQIVATNKILSSKVTVDIDFGQVDKLFAFKDTDIRDENNKPVVFNSVIDALNFMSANGYEFVQAYTVNVSNVVTYYYLMRKKKKE